MITSVHAKQILVFTLDKFGMQTINNVEGSLQQWLINIYNRFDSCPRFLKEIIIKVISSKVIIMIRVLMKLIKLTS